MSENASLVDTRLVEAIEEVDALANLLAEFHEVAVCGTPAIERLNKLMEHLDETLRIHNGGAA